MNLDKKNAKYLQAYLIITGFDMGSLIADGDVGDQTKKAILAYQEEMRLPTDNGELNLPTLDQINGQLRDWAKNPIEVSA